MENVALRCLESWDTVFLIFTDQAPLLLYYSHIPTAIVALFIGFFVFFKSKKSIAAKILLVLTIVFALWNLLNLVVWTNADSALMMFVWALFSLLYAFIYILSVYFVYTFIDKKDVGFPVKIIFFLILLPIIILYPTSMNLSGFNLISCEAIESPLFTGIYHSIGLAVFIWILGFLIHRYLKIKEAALRHQIVLLGIGIELFLLSFFTSSYWASYIDNFELEQYGLFGMVIFMGFLGYLIVQYKAFDVKVFGAQALVFAIVVLIGSQFFYVKSLSNLILNGIAFVLTLVAGYYLVKSVGIEVKQKEELQKLSDTLAKANARLKELDTAKSEFISIASHQLRTPLTAIKGYLSLILEGSYGTVPAAIQDVLDKLYTVNNRLTQLVEDSLNVSRIEAGRIQYNFQPTHLEALAAELVDMFALNAKSKNLYLKMSLPKKTLPEMMVDPNKIKEIMQNIIDNALKYTPEGGVDVIVENGGDKARIIIKDTGIGIKPEDKDHLFEKFIRSKETTKMVVSGAGLGLYVGKSFVEAHGGKVWAESEGPGKGSQFIIELPFVNPKVKQGVSDQVSALAPQEDKKNS